MQPIAEAVGCIFNMAHRAPMGSGEEPGTIWIAKTKKRIVRQNHPPL